MKLLNRIFNKNNKKYNDDELIEMGESLKNRILVLHQDTYNKITIDSVKKIKNINGIKYAELIGYSENLKCFSMLVTIKTYLKLCKTSVLFDCPNNNEIYIKELK